MRELLAGRAARSHHEGLMLPVVVVGLGGARNPHDVIVSLLLPGESRLVVVSFGPVGCLLELLFSLGDLLSLASCSLLSWGHIGSLLCLL